MKKIAYFLILPVIGMALQACDTYSKHAAQEAVKTAYQFIKVYYPHDSLLCASDSVYEQVLADWPLFSSHIESDATDDLIKASLSVHEKARPKRSRVLASIFGAENGDNTDSKYIAQFSPTYKNMIGCRIMSRDGRTGKDDRDSIITEFLFKYNDNGDIRQMIRIQRELK